MVGLGFRVGPGPLAGLGFRVGPGPVGLHRTQGGNRGAKIRYIQSVRWGDPQWVGQPKLAAPGGVLAGGPGTEACDARREAAGACALACIPRRARRCHPSRSVYQRSSALRETDRRKGRSDSLRQEQQPSARGPAPQGQREGREIRFTTVRVPEAHQIRLAELLKERVHQIQIQLPCDGQKERRGI